MNPSLLFSTKSEKGALSSNLHPGDTASRKMASERAEVSHSLSERGSNGCTAGEVNHRKWLCWKKKKKSKPDYVYMLTHFVVCSKRKFAFVSRHEGYDNTGSRASISREKERAEALPQTEKVYNWTASCLFEVNTSGWSCSMSRLGVSSVFNCGTAKLMFVWFFFLFVYFLARGGYKTGAAGG